MQSFDPRKQKRLGPAPIASFEKSFDDSNQIPPATTTAIEPLSYHSETVDATAATASVRNYFPVRNYMESKNNFGCNSSDPPPPPLPTMDTSVSESLNRNVSSTATITTTTTTTAEINIKTTPTKSGLNTGNKKPPLLHSKDSIHDHPLRAPLQSLAPLTPRIDISRASSSSQHEDSRESSPDNVFEQVGTGTLQEAISLGFREEGALDLRTSTEELYFMDPEQKREEQEKIQQEKMQQARKSPIVFKYDDQQLYLQQHQRKDSASSEVAALLCISGRTSRISSVGSQGSAISRLSAISAVSGVSRSPSPHRMLMETSFCGPKPVENVVENCSANSIGNQTAEILENVLLSRTNDLTQVILAEGIKLECSPQKKKPLPPQNTRKKLPAFDEISKIEDEIVNTKPISNPKVVQRKASPSQKKDAGKQIIGVTPTGTEYIRINLKPDYLYPDQGVAPNEKIIEVAGAAGAAADKPSTLKLSKDNEKPRPYTSPKQTRHSALTKDIKPHVESRSPSPAMPGASRKSSFCSLFKTKDSPDSPRDRSRSKSNDKSATHSQSGTPNKQKSVLAIFKPKRSGSKSKSSSPIDQEAMSNLDGISQVEFKFNSENQETSRPTSRLRYYDTPPDGIAIHIPLHTPPEEKETRKILPGITQEAILKQKEQLRSMAGPASQPILKEAVSSPQKIPETYSSESLDVSSKSVIAVVEHNQPLEVTVKTINRKPIENVKRIENLDAIHSLPDDVTQTQRTWSLEVHHHSSQESQDNVASENNAVNHARRMSKPNLDDVVESPVLENGTSENEFLPQSPVKPVITTVTVQQSQQKQHQSFQETKPPPTAPIYTPPNGDAISKEKKRILFATRLGSGSQEQIFSTQFSLSKTESLSSQLSDQNSIPDSPAELKETLHRTDTVLRRPDDARKKESAEEFKREIINKSNNLKRDERNIQISKPNNNEICQPVTLRKKEPTAESRKRNDDDDSRHSKYFENLDITKSFHPEMTLIKEGQNSSTKSEVVVRGDTEENLASKATELPKKSPHLTPSPTITSDRRSVTSTDEPIDTSESERDTEADPNGVKKHHPRHLGVIEDHESTGLVSELSFEDELPYVPTTLPEERAHGVSIMPVKERVNMEVITLSLDRPRSTTPMNPAHLEEYCEIATPDSETYHGPVRGEKLRISLPKKDCAVKERQQKAKSPRRISNASGKSWFEFAEQGIRGATTTTTPSTICTSITTPKDSSKSAIPKSKQNFHEKTARDDKKSSSPPPPLPPRKSSTTSNTSGQWINFENIPEKRKPPKKITALPKEAVENPSKVCSVQYNYVKPEECQCECHDSERETSQHPSDTASTKENPISSLDLLKHSSGEDLQPLLDTDIHDGIYRSDSSQDEYGMDEHQQIINQRRRNSKMSTNGNRSSEYSDGNEYDDDRQIDSSRPNKF